ncbi:hypothetical protein [Mycolicibacter arupensis]|jgi:hypothetical protein|uniref:Uncharacterized protein n=1 Tax=Mycolicibacter arupensis TaxID=342002 RepID=A0A5C7XL43_9MYCO|nr:hypothetical protein [Mycolicibacter arupensis]TXI50199.1 MAG: hypothetical protein E6Q54_21770 [Mycolicibacter arupensis]
MTKVHAAAADRREAALRCPPLTSGLRDPDTTDTRLHRPSTGLRASGFREGYARGAAEALREVWPVLDEAGRSRAVQLVARLEQEVA